MKMSMGKSTKNFCLSQDAGRPDEKLTTLICERRGGRSTSAYGHGVASSIYLISLAICDRPSILIQIPY